MNPLIKTLIEEAMDTLESMPCQGPIGEHGLSEYELTDPQDKTPIKCAVTHDAQLAWIKLQHILRLIDDR